MPPMSKSEGSIPSISMPDLDALQNVVHSTFSLSHLTVNFVQELPDHLHRIRLLYLSDGRQVVVKACPVGNVPMLKHERDGLETEALTLDLLARSEFHVPSAIRFESSLLYLGSPFLITTHLPGKPFAASLPNLSRLERITIEGQISSAGTDIGRRVSSTFGPVLLVSSGYGYATWKIAFTAMLEEVLKEAEDLFVNLPYTQIRNQVQRAAFSLDEVMEARLVVPNFGDARNVLIDEGLKKVTGLVDFKLAMWGDVDMTRAGGAPGLRGALYACYDAVVAVITSYYRPRSQDSEMNARRYLTSIINQLSAIRTTSM
ncbi:hypothetical protein MMC25_002288 [Agyrium rufum]|nr:hypothetical protein [Agyrium rufum]